MFLCKISAPFNGKPTHDELNSSFTHPEPAQCMASKLAWFNTCKAAQLKAIASATGINSSGTKAILTARLQQNLVLRPFAPAEASNGKNKTQPPHNILSIDMGIRNLAYCRLTLPRDWTTAHPPGTPTLVDWTRIAISTAPAPATPLSKEDFDPATYAQHAHTLIASLLRDPPSQILIERQRFRSMGGAAVQEWTLRVNMFEAMLYAVLRTYVARGLWRGAVHPVGPGKVTKFWLGGDAEARADTGAAKTASASARAKAAKIELVARWLDAGERFALQGPAAHMARLYLERWRRRKNGRLERVPKAGLQKGKGKAVAMEKGIPPGTDPAPASEPESIGKLDDLADCLLQGMAWIQWEQNRTAILARGLDAMDELESR